LSEKRVVEIHIRFVDCLKFWVAMLIVTMIPIIVVAIIMVALVSLMTATYTPPSYPFPIT